MNAAEIPTVPVDAIGRDMAVHLEAAAAELELAARRAAESGEMGVPSGAELAGDLRCAAKSYRELASLTVAALAAARLVAAAVGTELERQAAGVPGVRS